MNTNVEMFNCYVSLVHLKIGQVHTTVHNSAIWWLKHFGERVAYIQDISRGFTNYKWRGNEIGIISTTWN